VQSPSLTALLDRHDWPDNVRAPRNVVERCRWATLASPTSPTAAMPPRSVAHAHNRGRVFGL
jgi:DNA-binding NtrC family response regulator